MAPVRSARSSGEPYGTLLYLIPQKGASRLVDPLRRLRTALANRYAIQHEIGRGGMAVVFLARDLRHDRSVALKVLRPELGTAFPAERFLREIQIEAQLEHPYILPLFDSGEVDGLPFYVMPYVQGRSLRDRLKEETQLPLDEALRIATDIGEALAYAHEQGFVHRDVKPANILLDRGHALLADFGIARAVTALAGQRLTESGLIVGTPEYMSPEQGSDTARIDGRSDIYALGCVLYEMLAGEPPFTGRTAQAVIARHMHDRPRSLRVVRGTVPEYVEQAIDTALAKVPADRFATATDLVAALSPEGSTAAAARSARAARRRRLRRIAALLSLGVVGALAVWRLTVPPAETLDPNKVVLFPLMERGLPVSDSGTGYDVAVMLSAALEHAQPLRWVDGAQRLRYPGSGGSFPSAPMLRRVARAQRAGYYLTGTVLGSDAESTTVVLRLYDTSGDSVIAQESATGPRAAMSPSQLGLRAVTRLLPILLDPGRRIDLTSLAARPASATALWIQGEREYRGSRFRAALDFYQRALAEDSAMVFAALKGAEAASWQNLDTDARRLVAAAVEGDSLLPAKQRAFARGLQAYLSGKADSALAWLAQALAEDSEWAEVHMTLGEVYYHLLPAVSVSLDSMAHAHVSMAARLDSGFAPPLYHLAETAIRRGRLGEATALIQRFRRFDPDPSRSRHLAIMLECARAGASAVNWTQEATTHPMEVLEVSRALSVGGTQNTCAEAGFRAVLANPASKELHWGALLGLHGIAMSERRYEIIRALIDSAVVVGLTRAGALYFLDALAGAPVQAEAEATAAQWRSAYGEHYQEVSPRTRLLLAVWHAHWGDTVRTKAILPSLLSEAHDDPLPLRSVLEGHLALRRGDTTAAILRFRDLRLTIPVEELQWGLVEPLAIERMLLAKIALARGDYDEAHDVARVFDHPAPITYLPFVPFALDVRLRAAQGMGRTDLSALYEDRLRRLRGLERPEPAVQSQHERSEHATHPGSSRRGFDRIGTAGGLR
jgi:hypothetical protein